MEQLFKLIGHISFLHRPCQRELCNLCRLVTGAQPDAVVRLSATSLSWFRFKFNFKDRNPSAKMRVQIMNTHKINATPEKQICIYHSNREYIVSSTLSLLKTQKNQMGRLPYANCACHPAINHRADPPKQSCLQQICFPLSDSSFADHCYCFQH